MAVGCVHLHPPTVWGGRNGLSRSFYCNIKQKRNSTHREFFYLFFFHPPPPPTRGPPLRSNSSMRFHIRHYATATAFRRVRLPSFLCIHCVHRVQTYDYFDGRESCGWFIRVRVFIERFVWRCKNETSRCRQRDTMYARIPTPLLFKVTPRHYVITHRRNLPMNKNVTIYVCNDNAQWFFCPPKEEGWNVIFFFLKAAIFETEKMNTRSNAQL